MKWGDGDLTFARPIRWILAVYDGKTIPFRVGDVKSSNKSRGHRFMSRSPLKPRDGRIIRAGSKRGSSSWTRKRGRI